MSSTVRRAAIGTAAALAATAVVTGPQDAGATAAAAGPPELTHVGVHGEPSSKIGSETFKYALVGCPDGQRVLGGGARLVNRSSTPFYGRVVLTSLVPVSYRRPDGTYDDTYYADARELAGGFAGDWSIHVQAVCADDNPDNRLQIVRQTSSDIVQDGSQPRVRASHASCPSGTEVVGTGATIIAPVPGGQQVTASLQQVRPNQQGRYVYVEGITSPPTSWNTAFSGLHSLAVCADADLGQHVHVDGTEPNDDRVQFAPVRCGAGEEVTGAGMTKGDEVGLSHVETINPVASSPDKVDIEASAVTPDPKPWNIAAWAVCVP
jgi:hypothetical protein